MQAGAMCATCVLCLPKRLLLLWGIPTQITHLQQDGDQPAGLLAQRINIRIGELALPGCQRPHYAPKGEPFALEFEPA